MNSSTALSAVYSSSVLRSMIDSFTTASPAEHFRPKALRLFIFFVIFSFGPGDIFLWPFNLDQFTAEFRYDA